MCNSSAFSICETCLKKLTDSRINQIKKLIKLILRPVFCHEMVLSCNKGKKIMITNMITTSSTIFFYDNVMKHFTYIKNPYLNSLYGNSQIMTQKNTYKGGFRDLPNMPKLWISLKPLAFAQNSNNIKKNPNLNTCQDSTIAYYLELALLIVNIVSTFSGRQSELPWKI